MTATRRGAILTSDFAEAAQGGVLALAGALVSAALAFPAGHEIDTGQGQGGNRPALRGLLPGGGGGSAQPRSAGLVELLPQRQLVAEAHHHRQLRPSAAGPP